MAVFVSQSPTSPQLLFDTRPEFVANLESISTHVVRARQQYGAPSSMTFAIYGKWGSGKSTSLHFLENLIREKAKDSDFEVSVCQVDSPLWERLSDARAALAYEIVQAVSKKAFSDVTGFMERVAGRNPAAMPQEQGFKLLIDFLEIFKNAPATPMLERWMRDQVIQIYQDGPRAEQQNSTRPRILVVLIDDLDRCNRSFTADMLKATSYWQAVEEFSIFFIIAADKAHLIEAIGENGERGTQDPEQALEKYIHLSVEMPSFLDTPAEVALFLNRIADISWDDEPVAMARREELKAVINEAADTYPDCVFNPLFRHDGSGLTPRAVKHRFNTFLAEFKPESELRKADLKEWVLKAFWPEVWWQQLWNLRLGPEQCSGWTEKVSLVERLTRVGRDLLSLLDILESPNLSAEALVPTLGFLARKHNLSPQEIDPDLALYLAASPQWHAPSIGTQGIISESGPELWRHELTAEGMPQGERGTGELTPDNQILYTYWMAEKAEDQGNDIEAQRLLRDIAALVRHGGYGIRSAGTVGNAALIAERIHDASVALELHAAAHRIDPTHPNVAQNFVEFIIDERLAQFFEMAQEMLAELQDRGKDHKPTRTAMLALRLASLTGAVVSAGERDDAIEAFMQQLLNNPTVSQLTQLFSIGRENLPQAVATRACRTVCEAVHEDVEKYRALRLLADYLANYDDHSIEAEATDIYLYILRTGLACLADETRAMQVKNNLATLLASQDYDRSACLVWEDVYRLRPGDESIRRSFAICLSRLDYETEAAAVLIGQELPPLEVEPEKLPIRFARNVDHWWERVPIDQHPPCPLPALLASSP